MSLYLGENLISGVASPVEPTRNIGQIIPSAIPLTDTGLHLLDGALISGSGSYSAFVDYMADLYDNTKVYNPSAFTVVGSPNITDDGIASGFSSSNYLTISTTIDTTKKFNIKCKFTSPSSPVSGNKRIIKALNSTLMLALDGVNLRLWLGNGSSWSIIEHEIISSSITTDTDYTVEIEFTGTQYKVYLNGTLAQTYTGVSIGQTLTTIDLGNDSGSTSNYFSGSIDLKQFSIIVDGEEVFSGSSPSGFFTTEADWQTAVTNYGVCGKFVYDYVNNTVRLPKYSNKIYTKDIASNTPVVGNGKALGLTSTGTDYGRFASYNGGSYAYLYGNRASSEVADVGDSMSYSTSNAFPNSRAIGVTTNSAKSGLIAQLSNITASLDGYYYIVIATTAKTDIEVDIDEIATDLNGKADVDLTNINPAQSAKTNIASWGMPNYNNGILVCNTQQTSVTSVSYTAPSDGLIQGGVNPNGSVKPYINGVQCGQLIDSGGTISFFLNKNDIFTISPIESSSGIYNLLYFYPLKGV